MRRSGDRGRGAAGTVLHPGALLSSALWLNFDAVSSSVCHHQGHRGTLLALEPVLCPTGDHCGLRVGGRPTRVSGRFPPSPCVLVIVSSPGSEWVLVWLTASQAPFQPPLRRGAKAIQSPQGGQGAPAKGTGISFNRGLCSCPQVSMWLSPLCGTLSHPLQPSPSGTGDLPFRLSLKCHFPGPAPLCVSQDSSFTIVSPGIRQQGKEGSHSEHSIHILLLNEPSWPPSSPSAQPCPAHRLSLGRVLGRSPGPHV